MTQAAPTLKRLHFELGGKNPVVVFDDADLDRALDAVVFMIYSLNGERCTSSSRLLVQKSIEREFTERLVARVRKLKVGHPLDPATEVGPLIHPKHVEKVLGYFDIARSERVAIPVGGAAARAARQLRAAHGVRGCARTTCASRRKRSSAPCSRSFRSPTKAKRSRSPTTCATGLAAYLWTSDVGRAHRFARALEAGMVWVNSENNRHLPTPFGGMKASGIGRDGGDYSFDFYMETKNVCVAHGTHRVPTLGR